MEPKILSVKKREISAAEKMSLLYPYSWILVKFEDGTWMQADGEENFENWRVMDEKECQYICLVCSTPQELVAYFKMEDKTEEIQIERATKVWMGSL